MPPTEERQCSECGGVGNFHGARCIDPFHAIFAVRNEVEQLKTKLAELEQENGNLHHALGAAAEGQSYLQYQLDQAHKRLAEVEQERDRAMEGVHAACGDKHPEGTACILETVALVRERTQERDEARKTARELADTVRSSLAYAQSNAPAWKYVARALAYPPKGE